ncbi:receptor-like protein EIX2 [Triticum dicoccoides]|uniref:receptor-like protein EIX2 n=1 Tax=Triticum dicoccoides TaxID=85692 RepID=UPI001891E82A|nr:receptor-like protein EIX2 [Triticum dicoccoides]
MPPTTKFLLLVSAAAATFALSNGTGTGTAACVPRERDALLAFKRGVTDDPSGRLASWRRGSDCCRWRGIRCSNRTGHVLQLRLGNSYSYFDQEFYTGRTTSLDGQISPSLFSLEHLKHLDLAWNFPYICSNCGHVPKLWGSLKNLRYLNLSNVPVDDDTLLRQLGNLSKLQYLDLSYTTYTIVQPTDFLSLTHLPLLHHLDLGGFNLTMVHDWPRIVNMIPSLQVLYLSGCSLHNANQQLPRLNLTKLERLDLSYNHFDHPSESCWFWNLTSLKYLYLRETFLYGHFPKTLGQMTSLQVFDFSYNKYLDGGPGGIIAPGLMRNLCNLEVLYLEEGLSYGNMAELHESLPHCSSSRLRELYLNGNNITGTLPAGLAQFSSLATLILSDNYMNGPVPTEIGRINDLIILDLRNNNLTGVITEEHFYGFTNLQYIDLSNNFASCQIGPHFPSWLRLLPRADYIDMSDTGITGQLPYWFSTTLSQAIFLNFSHNQISGSLPKNMESMSVNYLYLDRNQITGEIPPLPENLTCFSISNNSLSGRITRSICKTQKLKCLDLRINQLEGEFPQCIKMGNIRSLILSNNMFSGKFPSFLQSTNIKFLDLSRNKFSGRLPEWIGDLMALEYIGLSYNMFSGSIPSSIINLGEMFNFDVAGNRLSGVIPRNLSTLTGMAGQVRYLNVDSNWMEPQFILPVLTKRQELHYKQSFANMSSIDLSLNYLTGVIPEEITSVNGLMNLNISWNYLTGEIPRSIGSMESLESLDLSRNKLCGEIPLSLSNLTYLESLDLSYNNLSGRIPPGSQLDTLYDNYPYMYSGNIGLCGHPLQRNCSRSNNATKLVDGDTKRSARVSDSTLFYLGLGSGFVVGLWVVLCTMLFKKTWRIAYFRLFDKVYDKLYVFLVLTWARLAQKALNLTGKLG